MTTLTLKITDKVSQALAGLLLQQPNRCCNELVQTALMVGIPIPGASRICGEVDNRDGGRGLNHHTPGPSSRGGSGDLQ